MNTLIKTVCLLFATLMTTSIHAAVIARYEFNTNGSFAPTTVATGVTASDLLKGPGVTAAYWSSGTIATNSITLSHQLSTAVSAGDYFEVQVSPPTGMKLSLTSFSFNYIATAGVGINYFANFYGRSSVEGFGGNMTGTTWPKLVNATNTLNVNVPLGLAYSDLSGTVSFRIYMTDRESFDGSSHQARVDNIQIEGSVVPEPLSLVATLLLAPALLLRRW